MKFEYNKLVIEEIKDKLNNSLFEISTRLNQHTGNWVYLYINCNSEYIVKINKDVVFVTTNLEVAVNKFNSYLN
jgi:hypothetical protein